MKLRIIFLCLLPFITNLWGDEELTNIADKYNIVSGMDASEDLKQNINLGFSNTMGNTNNLNLNLKYDLSHTLKGYRNKNFEVIFDTALFFSQSEHQKSDEEYLLNLACKQELQKQWLSYFALHWLRNPEFKNYEHKLSLGLGFGRHLFFDGKQSVTLKIGISHNFEAYHNQQSNQSFDSLNEYLEYNNQLNKLSKIYLKMGLLENTEAFNTDYEAVGIFGVNFKVGEAIALTLAQEIAYDNQPPIGFQKTDSKSIIRLGYHF